ncbi:MAG: SIMPL domain-containing protein [Phycisphaerales bacterium]|nr:SIMPL domain-containing protein [Phycisphaerales bacterium]
MTSCPSTSLNIVALAVLLTTLAAEPLRGQDFKPDNAAYWYQQASNEIMALPEEDLNAIYLYLENPIRTPNQRVVSAMERCKGAIALLHKGAHRQYCDHHLDYSQGVSLLVPHLSPLRTASKILAADAKLNLAQGNTNKAVESLNAGYRISDHTSSDSLFISSLVSVANFTSVDQQVQQALDRAELEPSNCDRLLSATKQLREKDFNFLESMAMEQVMMSNWAIREFESPGSTDLSFEELQIDPLLITQRSLDENIREYDQAMDEFMVIFQEEDLLEQERKLLEWSNFVEGGGYGQLAAQLTPAFDKVAQQITATNLQLDQRIATLEKIASGNLKPAEKVNAAIIYQNAFTRYKEIPDEQKLALLAIDPGAPYQTGPTINQEDITAALALFAEAAMLEQCDFSVLLPEPSAPLGPWYTAHMRNGIRAILLRAAYHLANNRFEDATADLNSAYRMIHHLSEDHRLLSAMVAQQSIREANRILARIIAEKPQDPIGKDLRQTVTNLSVSDPFGYIQAIENDTADIRFWTTSHKHIAPSMSSADLLTLMAIIDTLAQAGTDRNNIRWTEVELMPRIIDLEALEQARQRAPQMAYLLKSKEVQMIIDSGLPDIASLTQRKQDARSDIRQVWRLLDKKEIGNKSSPSVSE